MPQIQLSFDFHSEAMKQNLIDSSLQVWNLWYLGHIEGKTHEAQEELNKRFGELTEPLVAYKRIGEI